MCSTRGIPNNRSERPRRGPDWTGMLVAVCLAVVSTGCPTASSGDGVVETCERTGQQCRLKDNQLGVCMKTPDGEFRCQPQH